MDGGEWRESAAGAARVAGGWVAEAGAAPVAMGALGWKALRHFCWGTVGSESAASVARLSRCSRTVEPYLIRFLPQNML